MGIKPGKEASLFTQRFFAELATTVIINVIIAAGLANISPVCSPIASLKSDKKKPHQKVKKGMS